MNRCVMSALRLRSEIAATVAVESRAIQRTLQVTGEMTCVRFSQQFRGPQARNILVERMRYSAR